MISPLLFLTAVRVQAYRHAASNESIFEKPISRKGDTVNRVQQHEVWVTQDLDEALTQYRAACLKARNAIEEKLRLLSQQLQVPFLHQTTLGLAL